MQTLEKICTLKQDSLLNTMSRYLVSKYGEDKVTRCKDFILAEGDVPIALVAHLDTVFTTPPKQIYYDQRQGVMWSPQGLGADDRAGVFAIVNIISQGYRPHIIFTTDEEIGGIGAEALAKAHPRHPFSDLRYLIELDRRGTNDCVFYDGYNRDFTDYVEKFGFVEGFGSYSDICSICPQWGIAGVNLSIGYEDEHTLTETLNIGAMIGTINRVKLMLEQKVETIPTFAHIPARRYSFTPIGWGDPAYGVPCYECSRYLCEYEAIPVKGIKGDTAYYCSDCMVGNVQWCDVCQEAFEVDPLSQTKPKLCRDCQGGAECKTSKKSKNKSNKSSNTHKASKTQKQIVF